ncbi:cadherin-86C isoform X3 [Solenopsis invicta]|uniref:cadherin-86C isoform X3 n=1 Tax=Solenopsis invicta TaxID=13686 RepID=UPI00193D0180|nr:cadherin-86C isoform X3 [Solenopsis invicta]
MLKNLHSVKKGLCRIVPSFRMPLVGAWFKAWVYLGLVYGWGEGARPRFDTSTDMGLVLVPADAEVDSVIFRLRATDQDADFPLIFEITATITPVVRIDNLPCTLYNKVCQANVILTKRLMPGRLHDFAVRVRDTKGDSNSMQATISATNATTSRDKIFPHIPSLIMVPEDAKPGRELDYILVRANSWSGKPVYIELWQPKELFTIRQRQTTIQTRGVITLIGELDFETQSMYTLTIYATDPYTEPGKDTRNIAGLNIIVVVLDVQDVPPIFTLAPPLTRLNNSVQIGDVILRVHAEDGDKGVPREITYGLVSEGNPFIPFFNISETTGEIVLAKPLDELTQITHVGAPVVLTVVAEEIRRSRDEPPAQATVVDVGFLLGEPGNSPPYFENDNYVASIPENLEPGSVIMFPEQYSTRVRDEDIGKAGVFALKLQNNNGTFEINPTVAERTADFILMVRDNTLIDYEMHESLSFKIIAQEVGPATNLSASATVLILIQDVNDNPPVFDEESYEVTLSENVTAGTRVIQVHATDKDTGIFGSIRYTGIEGIGSDAFAIDAETGLITVAMGSSLDREMAAQLQLTITARDENGKGNMGTVPLIVNLLDVNDNAPIFEKDTYEFALNSDLTNFSTPAIIKATDADAEPPNNEIRYELIHGNYENKFYLDEITGELILRSPITKFRRKKQSVYDNFSKKLHKGTQSLQPEHTIRETVGRATVSPDKANSTTSVPNEIELKRQVGEIKRHRRKRAEPDILYTLTARAYDLGVPHLASETEIFVVRSTAMEARIMMFVVPGERPNLTKTAETLATITGGRITVLDTRPYVSDNKTGVASNTVPTAGKRTIVIARVEQTEIGTPLVDVEKIRNTLAANGVGIIGGADTANGSMTYFETTTKLPINGIIPDGGDSAGTSVNKTISNVHEEVTVYKAENKLLFWLLIILGLLMLIAIAALIICCICPGCPFYMAPRKRRIYSSETLIARSNGRPKRHLHRKPAAIETITSNGRKQAWSADPTRRNWQFNRRNTKNGGLASLPGDVVYISERPPIDQANVESLRLRDGPAYDSSRRRLEEQERMYMEDVEERKIRDYDGEDSLQRHEIERGSDIQRQAYRQRYVDPELNNERETAIREQHFYREGNAEVLQLVTRGQVEDRGQHRHYPTFVVDGKDVLLQRFIQDQKTRNELPMQEAEMVRTIDSHQRSRNLYQHKQEVLLLPEELDVRRRRTIELESGEQKMDDEYATQNMDMEPQMRDVRRQEISINMPGISSKDRPSIVKDQKQSTAVQSIAFHDMELARQNALLTRLLLERESRHTGGTVMDAASYLETQSLPGQVAIATQTDRAAATQTERHVRSRSDNDESDEDTRNRKRMKKRHGEDEFRTRTLWMKTPIEEEEGPCFDKRLSILRKKVQEVKEGRKISIEPEVLREISDSLDENGSTYREKERKSTKTCQHSSQYTEESSIGYKVLGEEKNGSSSSMEVGKQHEKFSDEKRMESLSSPEISIDNGKYIRETTEEKSSRKESKIKKQKKVESVIKPSFRVLEREITMLTKKLSKLTDKKGHQTTESESTSQEKSRTSRDSKKDSDQSTSKKVEDSKKHKRFDTSPSISKEVKREKFKYQQPQIMSPGSSEYEDAFEKSEKSKLASRQETAKLKQTSHAKVKKQKQIEHKERKKQIASQDREFEKRRDAGKEKDRSKAEKTAKIMTHRQKLATIGRKEHVHVSEAPSTSTSSDRTNGKNDSFFRDFDKKSTEPSEIPSTHACQQKSKQRLDHVGEEFSDDFVTESQRTDIDQQITLHSPMDGSADKKDIAKEKEDIEIIQQFSDDFTMESQVKELEHHIETAVEKKILSRQDAYHDFNEEHISPKKTIVIESEQDLPHDFGKEHVTLKEAAEDVTILRDLEDMQVKEGTILDIASREESESVETSNVELDDNSKKAIPSDSPALKALEERETEKLSSYNDKSAIEKRIAYMSEKHKEAAEESFYETEKEMLEKQRLKITPEEKLHDLQKLKDVEKIASEEASTIEKHVESLKELTDTTEHTEEEHKENGLSNDIISLASEIEKDSEDIKDISQSLYSSEKDETIELYKSESDQEKELSSESKKHIKEVPLIKDAKDDIGQTLAQELMQKKNGEDSSREIKSDTEKLEDHVTQEFDAEKIEESTTEALDVSRSVADDTNNLNGTQKAFAIDDDTITYIDETSDEASKSDHDLTQSELTEPDVIKKIADEDKPEHLSDDLTAKTETEFHETKEESRISPKKISDLHEEEQEKIDEDKLLTPLVDTISKEEVIKEQLVEHSKEKEKSLLEEYEERTEEISALEERPDEKIKEVFDEEPSTDQLSKDSNLQKPAISEPDQKDSFVIISESAAVVGPQDEGEQQADENNPDHQTL